MKSAVAGLALLLAAGVAAAALAAEGVWLTDGGKSHVEIRPCGVKPCRKIAWPEEPTDENGSPKLDKYNQDESLRSRPILGISCETQTWTRVR